MLFSGAGLPAESTRRRDVWTPGENSTQLSQPPASPEEGGQPRVLLSSAFVALGVFHRIAGESPMLLKPPTCCRGAEWRRMLGVRGGNRGRGQSHRWGPSAWGPGLD